MTNLKRWAAVMLATSSLFALACDDDTGVPPDSARRTTSPTCPVVRGSTSSGSTAIDDGDCTTAGSGTSGGNDPLAPFDDAGALAPVVPTGR